MDGTAFVLLLFAIFSVSKSEPAECNALGVEIQVADEKAVLTSPGYDTEKGLDNVRCLWVLKGPEDKFVEFTITNVNLSNNSQCLTEYLELDYDDSVEPYLRYCGQIKPEKVIVPIGSNPRVLFVSQKLHDSIPAGFRLEYKLVDQPQQCDAGFLACKHPFKCIPSDKKCDGHADCIGGEDEAQCNHQAIQPSTCGVPTFQPDMDRIVGGQVAVPGSWPWLVSIQANYIWPSGHGCGGVLLNNLYVLTAAHCVVGRFFRAFRVKFGDYNQYKPDEGEFTRDLEMFYLHPNYNRFNSTDDLAILKFSAPITFTDTVSPICLPGPKENLPAGTVLYVAGWGTTEKLEHSDVVRQVSVPVIGTDKCEKMVVRKLPERTVCTGHEGGGKNPCFGDSGGPLMKRQDGRWIVEGVVSWGPTVCGVADEAAVYTKISDHIEWINKVISV